MQIELCAIKYEDEGPEMCLREDADVFGVYVRKPDKNGDNLANWVCDQKEEKDAREIAETLAMIFECELVNRIFSRGQNNG